MVSLISIERLDVFLVAIIFVGQSLGNDYMMTCSRPVVTKTARLLKFDLGVPCDLSKESWCNLPGTNYPWHAVRSFVFENQGLMRRMYGEVRQLSVLRMEFNGNSIDENNSVGREFDEIFKPVSPTMSPTTTTSTTTSSTSSPPSTSSTSSSSSTTSTSSSSTSSSTSPSYMDAESIFMDNFNRYYSNNEDGSSVPTAPVTIVVRDSDSSHYESDADANTTNFNDAKNISSSSSSNNSVTNENKTSDININNKNVSESVTKSSTSGSGHHIRDSTDDMNTSMSSESESLSRGSLDEITGGVQMTTTTEENAGTTEGILTTMMADSPIASSGSVSMDEDVTTETPQHVLFQDAERTTTTTSTSKSRTTTRTTDENEKSSEADADAPQQIHRSDIKGVNACPVKEEVVAPYWANNTRGEVLALLNLYPFEQYIHWEKCTFEHRQMYCRDGCRCEQQYRLHRLLAFDPTNECRGIFSDWFRFPSCCVCKCYLTSSDLAQERFSFNRSPRFEQAANDYVPVEPVDPVNGVDDSHFYYKTSNFGHARQPR